MYEGKKKIRFKTREETILNIFAVGVVGLIVLTVISLLFIFLSVAEYAATIDHHMSFVDYLYNNDYDHSILKFILFITGGLGLIIGVSAVIVGLVYYIFKRNWFGTTMLVFFITSIVFLFFVPFRQNEKVYFVKGTIRTDMLTEKQYENFGRETYKTGNYSSSKEARKAFEMQALIPIKYFKTEVKTRIKKVDKPLITIRLPNKPLEYDDN